MGAETKVAKEAYVAPQKSKDLPKVKGQLVLEPGHEYRLPMTSPWHFLAICVCLPCPLPLTSGVPGP